MARRKSHECTVHAVCEARQLVIESLSYALRRLPVIDAYSHSICARCRIITMVRYMYVTY
jgi:hypothetical protein